MYIFKNYPSPSGGGGLQLFIEDLGKNEKFHIKRQCFSSLYFLPINLICSHKTSLIFPKRGSDFFQENKHPWVTNETRTMMRGTVLVNILLWHILTATQLVITHIVNNVFDDILDSLLLWIKKYFLAGYKGRVSAIFAFYKCCCLKV